MPQGQIFSTIIRALMILLAVYVVMTTGEGLFPRVKRRYTHRSYADRGLWFDGKGFSENSVGAVMHAADLCYGSRIDVRLTRDRVPVAFADPTLERASGDSRRIGEVDYEQLKDMTLFGEGRISTLEEILTSMEAREDRAPLLLNLHPDTEDPKEILAFCEAVTKVFYPYRYFCAVESHSTDVVSYYARNYSNIVRGLLMLPREESDLPEKEYKAMNRMLRNMKTRPQFFDTTAELYGLLYWVPVTMGSFVILRGITGEESRAEAKKVYGTESVIFHSGTPKAEF